MLTKDFIEAVEELGFNADNRWPDNLYVETLDDEPNILVTVSKSKLKPHTWHRSAKIFTADAAALVKLVEEYDNTPLEERGEAEELSIDDLNESLVEAYVLRKLSPYGLAKLMEKMLESHGRHDTQYNITSKGTTKNTIPKPM